MNRKGISFNNALDECAIYDSSWNNGYSLPCINITTGEYYAIDIYDGKPIKRSHSNSLRQLRRKMGNYISEHIIEQEAAF